MADAALLMALSCSPLATPDDPTMIEDITLSGPAVLQGEDEGKVRTGALLKANLTPTSAAAQRYLDADDKLGSENDLPFLFHWRMLLPDGTPFPSSFFEHVPNPRIGPGESATVETSLSVLVPAGDYTLEFQFYRGGLALNSNAIAPPLRRSFQVHAPPALSTDIHMGAHYSVAASAFSSVGSSDTKTSDVQLTPAEGERPATLFVNIDQAQANAAYSLGFFTFNQLPPWIARITFTSSSTVKTNLIPLTTLPDNSQVTIAHTPAGQPVLDNLLLPLSTAASGSSQGLIQLLLQDKDGLSLRLNLHLSLHVP